MATVTTSTLNKKLSKVSNIRFCTSAGKNMCTKIYTGENGRFTIKVGFKQNSTVNPFQVQYRQHSRYTAANAKKKGADWTSWGSWKNAIAVRGIALNSTKNPDTWLKSNSGVNKKSSYKTCFTFTNTLIGSDYDARAYQFRVRTYNSKTKKHGSWVTQTLYVYKSAAVVNETMHRTPEGGIMFDVNYKWDRGGTVYLDSIVDSEERELLNSKLTKAVNYDSNRTATSNPPTKTGYTPGEFEVGVADLKRSVDYGEALTLNVYYKTKDGAKTAFTCKTISTEDTSINVPIVDVTKNETAGIVYVYVYKSDADDVIEYSSCSATYTYNGSKYTISPYYKKLNLSAMNTTDCVAEYRFRPPIGLELTISTTISNDYKSSRTVVSTEKLGTPRFILNKSDGTIYATLAGNAKLSTSTQRTVVTALPYGRSLPMAFLGSGTTNEITLSGKIVENNPYVNQSSGYAKFKYWNKVRSTQGLFLLRCPNGEMYNVCVYKVDISSEVDGIRDITVSMYEVS